jgi:hypothetical protein
LDSIVQSFHLSPEEVFRIALRKAEWFKIFYSEPAWKWLTVWFVGHRPAMILNCDFHLMAPTEPKRRPIGFRVGGQEDGK